CQARLIPIKIKLIAFRSVCVALRQLAKPHYLDRDCWRTLENRDMLRSMIAKFSVAMLFAIAPVAVAQSLAGRWDATVQVSGLDIPFRFELSGEGTNVKGSFFNGDERITSTSGRFENGSLTLRWDDHASSLEARLHEGVLEGKYRRDGRDEKSQYPFSAKRYSPPP